MLTLKPQPQFAKPIKTTWTTVTLNSSASSSPKTQAVLKANPNVRIVLPETLLAAERSARMSEAELASRHLWKAALKQASAIRQEMSRESRHLARLLKRMEAAA